MTVSIEHHQAELINYLIQIQAYQALEEYLGQTLKEPMNQVLDNIHLAQAILRVDIDQVEQLAVKCQQSYLLKPSAIQQKVYFYSHYLNLQLKQHEYGDYFRGLTPVLVDVFRLLIENDFMPEINHYMIPVVKDTVDGQPLYRGLQWYQPKIESSTNKIQSTFNKYYGEHFNYEHYVSSTHLIKLIDDYSNNERMKELAKQLRFIEKYMRNIIAHEVICVDDALVKTRVNLTIEEVQKIYLETLTYAGLTDQRQWDVFNQIHQTIRQALEISE